LASVHGYKRFENSLVARALDGAARVGKGLGAFFLAVGRAVTRRYTVVLIPYSGKRVYNLQVSVFSVFCFFLIITGVAGAVLWYGASGIRAQGSVVDREARLRDTQANLDLLRDEVTALLKEARSFEPALSDTLNALGMDVKGLDNGVSAGAGDLASFFDIDETPEGGLQEVEGIRRFAEYLATAAEPVREIGALLNSQSALLTEIPSIWPIQGGIGHVSMYFGQNVHPFFGNYYIHKGIDLSTYRQGDPVVATADGQVVSAANDSTGFGLNVVIRHKHGFYTRYGHMLRYIVTVGQRVQQGEIIGYIGNTGMSTGPHLHYEVHIGSDVVDPYKYLNIRSSIAKTGR